MNDKELVASSGSPEDQALLDEAVRFINEKANESVYKAYHEIGAYLLERFFDNNMELASSRNPQKPVAYRALCEHQGLAIHPSRLGEMVRVAAQEKYFTDNRVDSDKLSYTHKAELIKIPNGPEKIRLVKKIIRGSLSTRRATELVAEHRNSLPRKELPLGTILAHRICDSEKLFDNSDVINLLSNEELLVRELRKLKPKKRDQLHKTVVEIIERTREWNQKYELLRRGPDKTMSADANPEHMPEVDGKE